MSVQQCPFPKPFHLLLIMQKLTLHGMKIGYHLKGKPTLYNHLLLLIRPPFLLCQVSKMAPLVHQLTLSGHLSSSSSVSKPQNNSTTSPSLDEIDPLANWPPRSTSASTPSNGVVPSTNWAFNAANFINTMPQNQGNLVMGNRINFCSSGGNQSLMRAMK